MNILHIARNIIQEEKIDLPLNAHILYISINPVMDIIYSAVHNVPAAAFVFSSKLQVKITSVHKSSEDFQVFIL